MASSTSNETVRYVQILNPATLAKYRSGGGMLKSGLLIDQELKLLICKANPTQLQAALMHLCVLLPEEGPNIARTLTTPTKSEEIGGSTKKAKTSQPVSAIAQPAERIRHAAEQSTRQVSVEETTSSSEDDKDEREDSNGRKKRKRVLISCFHCSSPACGEEDDSDTYCKLRRMHESRLKSMREELAFYGR